MGITFVLIVDINYKMENKEKEKETDKPIPREINAWMLSYRHPDNREFPEWFYGIRFQYWDWK